MQYITLYRRDFVNHSDDGESMFNEVLRDLKLDSVPGSDINNIDEIQITVDSYVYSNED